MLNPSTMNGLISLASRWGTHTLKHFMLPFPLFFLFIATAFSQGGPAGVGNSAGSDGQPQLNLWLDAADADLSGTQVLQLNDLSGNNYHAFQNTVSFRPQQFPNILNGRPVIRFNGTSMLETPGMPYNPGSLSYLGVSKSEHTGTDRGTLMHSLAWLGGWEYRKLITIEGKPGAGNDYTVKLTIGQSGDTTDFDFHLDNFAAAFPDDFRFTQTDGETLLDFWVEEVTGTVPNQTATVWVKIPGNLDMNQDIYLYYGNSSASPAGNPFNTFLFYDDFNRPDVADITVEDAYTQTNGGSWAIADNKLRNVGADGDPNKLLLAELGPVNYPVLMKTRISIQTFASVDASRVGLSQCMEVNGQGYAALFRNFNGRFRFLNDLRSWGGNTLSNPNWNLNTWYNLEFYITNPADRNGWVRFWEVNTPATAFENLNFGNGNARNWGYIGFAGSRRTDISWFDDIIVRKYITDEPAFLSAAPIETISSVSSSKFLHQYEGINFSTSHTHAGSTEQITGTGSAGFHINGVISQATGGEIYLNGAQTGSATWTDVNFPTFAQYNIGRNGLSGTEGLVGDIAELMVFNHDLNQAQRIIIENYLSAKYDVTLTSGKYYHHTTFTEDLTGIGITTGHHKHTATSGNGSALYLAASGNSLDDKTHTFLMAAHDATAHGTTSDDIDPLSGATQRWARSWYLEKTGTVPFDVMLGFHFPEASQTLLPNQIYTLLYRETEAEEFTTFPGSLTTGTEDRVWFEIAAEDFQNGYYTIAPIDNKVWYAFAEGIFGDAGYWDQPGSWTLAADGTWVNPENRTPETSLTSHLDLVVIPQGKSIVVRQDGCANPVLDVREGTLDFQQTSGHQFNTITGSGKIRLQGDNFPVGNATAFSGATGGTVEYYGNSEILLTIPRTFNHMVVDMNSSGTKVIIATDYTLNGHLTIRKGTLQLNNDEHPEPVSDIRRTLIIKKDLSIQNEGHFRVGLANTNNSALDLGNEGGPYVLAGNTGLAAGSRVPADYNYHSLYHQIEIRGNFSNRGTAIFTNQPQPVYDQINGHEGVTHGQTGSAVVWFKGATDNLMDLYGTTDFYHLIIDKGTNRDNILTVQSEDEAFFRLFGSNILRGAGGGPNPEIRKALWIKTGTLRLKENIHIPTLTEGRDGTNSPNADFYIPANGGLWIDGATVYGTADNAAETNVGGVEGSMLSNSNGDYQGNIQSTSFYGNFRITSGLYSTRRSGGLIVWAQGDPVVRIEGGTLDAAQFRSAGNSTQNNRITLQITGGTINLRGNINGTAMEGGKGTFSMLGDHNVFLMEDGLIKVWDGIGAGGAFELNIHPANINISGGTVQLMMDNSLANNIFRNNYFINTRAPLWDLELLTTETNSMTMEPVRLYRELTIQNNLLVGDQIPFRAGRNNTDGPFYDLHIGGDFILGETSTSTAQYYPSSDDGTLGNTTRFFGNNLSRITVASSSPATHINFHRLLLDKFGEDTLQIVSPGRPVANITYHPAQHSPVNISNALLIHRGLLDYNLFMIRLNDDVQIQNFGAIGRMDDMNGYLALEYPGISVELPDNREAQFGRVLVADDTEFSGAVNFLVGDLYMENGVVRIGSSGMKVKGDIFNSGPVDFGTEKLVLTSGNHSDRGILQNIMAPVTYHFPLGINTKTNEGIRYTPAYMNISGLTTADGWVQVNNVDNELSTLNEGQDGQQALQYYWRIRHEGFDAAQMPVVENNFVFHNPPVSYLANPFDTNLTEGKVVNYQRKHTLGSLNWNDQAKQLDLTFAFKETDDISELSPLESGEFTAAHINRFSGALQVFYTYRKTDNDPPDESKPWNRYQAWSMAGHEDYVNPEQLIPGDGDVVFIGYDSNNHWHRVETQNNLQLAEVVFNYDPAFPRPRLTIGKDHLVTLNVVKGTGEMEALVDSENAPQINGDLGEYISEDNSSFLYNAGSTGLVTGTVLLPATPSVFPELKIEASSIKESGGDVPHFGDFIFTFPENITVRGDMYVRDGAVYRTHDGAGGDIHIRGNLNLAGLRQSEFRFNGTGSSRSLWVDGNILLAPIGDPAEQLAFINVESGLDDLNHYLYLGGDLIMQDGQDVRLNLGTANVRVELHLVGENNGQFVSTSASNPVFGRIIMNKGNNPQPSFSFNSNFTLTGTTNGTNKAIEMRNGTLVLNDSQINLDLTTGGDDFSIPPTAALIVSDGRVNATGNNTGIYLAGLLRLENHAQAHFYSPGSNTNNTYIHYSSGGTAQLQVLNDASLTVGSQIRGNTDGSQETGILKYLQTGGEVIVGRNTIPNNSRAAFEVFNPGSEFIMEAGDLYIARNQANTYRAALFLHPDIYQMGNSARIFVGHPTINPGSNTIRVNSAPTLSNLIIEGSSTTLLNEITPLTVEKLLHIKAGNQLNMNQETLILRGNLLNEGNQAELHDSKTIVEGTDSDIYGEVWFNKLQVNLQGQLQLHNDITVLDSLILLNGNIRDEGNAMFVQGHIINQATHISGTGKSVGGLILNGASLQEISGSGEYGNVELLNNEGVRLKSNMRMSGNLRLGAGILQLQNHRLSLGLQSVVEGAPFSTSKMITTSGGIEARGLEKRLDAGQNHFLFPIGTAGKYTPVLLEAYTVADNNGLIAFTGVNEQHSSTVDYLEDGQTGDVNRVLQYHWTSQTSSLSGFNANIWFTFDKDDLPEDVYEMYISALLLDDYWTKLEGDDLLEELNHRFKFIENESDIPVGFFTYGHRHNIPEKVPAYRTIAPGNWNDVFIWEKTQPDMPDLQGNGPFGNIVYIEHEVTIPYNDQRSYITHIESGGRLNIGTTSQHRLGEVRGNGTFTINRGLLPAGKFDDFFSNPGSTIIYGGNEPYTLTDRYLDVQNIVFTGDGRITLPNKRLTIRGNLRIEESVLVTTDADIYLQGDLTKTNDATFAMAHKVSFTGSAPQKITGSFIHASAFENLESVNNNGGLTLASGTAEIRNQLSLLNGARIFTSSENNLTLNNQNPYGTIHPESFVSGPLQRNISHNSLSARFIIGDNDIRRDLYLLDPMHGGGMQYWQAEYFHSNPITDIGDGFQYPPFNSIQEQEYWKVTPPATGNPQSRIGLTYGPETGIDDDLPGFAENIAIAFFEGQWLPVGDNPYTYHVESDSKMVSSEGMVMFYSKNNEKYFTFGSKSPTMPLPVELLYFTAEARDKGIVLQWATASETGNDFFTIERSRDGKRFEPNGIVESQASYGNSNRLLVYEFSDNQPLPGLSYYRLKQTDLDGNYTYSPLVGVNFQIIADIELKLFPNPNSGNSFRLAINGLNSHEAVDIHVHDLYGRLAFTDTRHSDARGTLQAYIVPGGRLPAGVYMVTISGLSGRIALRMVVR